MLIIESRSPCATYSVNNPRAQAIDLFCGAGGLTYGLQQAGLNVVEGVDLDRSCQDAYQINTGAHFIAKDIREYTVTEIETAWSSANIRILVGCAPCQPFSTYTYGSRNHYKHKWILLESFATLVEKTQPELVSMENVPPLQDTDRFRKFVRGLDKAGYRVSYQVIDCRYYGVPQKRRRLVLLASKLGPINLLPPTHACPATWTSVASAIGHLPPVRAGDTSPHDSLHRASQLSDLNMARIKASKPGGSWNDWPKNLVAPCHQRISGKTFTGVYGRMEWNKPAPTITGQCYSFGSGRFGHPEQDRALTLREAAILQTFPEKYKFESTGKSPSSMKSIGRMIGNAVPPRIGRVIGKSIIRHLSC